MTDQELKKEYTGICNSLAARRLKPAFDKLAKLIADNGLGVYYDEHRNLEETYKNMLRYTVEGVSDPERQKVYRRLIVSVFELADKVREALRMKYSPSFEYTKKRIFKDSYITDPAAYLGDIEKLLLNDNDDTGGSSGTSSNKDKTVQEKVRRFFYQVWFTDKLTDDEAGEWKAYFSSTVLPVPYRSLLVTAATFSLQRYFDPVKFAVLFDLSAVEEPEISQRALVGLLINLYYYDQRLKFYPEIDGRLKIFNEQPAFKRRLEAIIIQFIRSKGTEKLQQRIREEILPEMIKLSPNLKEKINLDSLMEEGLSEDRNPDWEDIFKDSPGLLNKMEEFSEMQMKGDDVFMGSFSMLKSFPFFNEMSNWFMPFFPANPEISEDLDIDEASVHSLLDGLDQAPILCNSDKYSFCLSIPRLPKENLEFMTQAMQAEMEQIREVTSDETMLDPGRKGEFISNQYIQDLYRFFKLFPRKADFDDIFGWPLDFHNTEIPGGIIREDPKMLRNIAEYYFAKEYFMEAAGIFGHLLEQEKNEELYQKYAWCYQKSGDFKTALDAYLKAELYGTNNVWNLKKIGLCYHNLKQPDKALEYYRSAEKLDPDNLSIQLNIGHCLLELNRYDDALQTYFKIEYLTPGNNKVWRPIGWCSFLTGKKEQAEKYLKKLIDDQPNKHDYVSMGHVQWSLGNRKAALDFYRQSMSENGFSEKEFLKIFEEDKPHLIEQGVEEDDVPIMLDELRYLVE